jgi:tetraacyldisaccharide 4'-kinase
MIAPTDFREVVSGRRTGLGAALLRIALRGASFPYAWVVAWRNRRYDREDAAIHQAAVPVISVGNLTVGGTGKTPMVQWIARYLRDHGLRVAVLSRGYGAIQTQGREGSSTATARNDEALELELALPDVPHLQNADRVAAAAIAVDELEMEVLLLDDGFQHRRLARDIDIVLLDASEPFGFDYLLPRGTLRESVGGLARADVVVLSRADMLPASARAEIRQRVARVAPQAYWAEVVHRPAAWYDCERQRYDLQDLTRQPIAAFCGIGNPAGLRHTLDHLGCQVVAWREFPDHHPYSRQDVESLAQWAVESEARFVVCTRKDLVKLRTRSLGHKPLRSLEIEIDFLAGETEVRSVLAEALSLDSTGER